MSSNIRIVQAVLRGGRKNKLEPDKIMKIILPIINREDWLENNNNHDLKKVREVVYQMGQEDVSIEQKIKAFHVDMRKTYQRVNDHDSYDEWIDEFDECDDELTTRIRLKTVKRAAFGISYDKAKQIVATYKIKSKEEYNELCERDNRLTTDPESAYKGNFTNWIDYLGLERNNYYDMATCKAKVVHYLTAYPDIKRHLELSVIADKLCKLDSQFPPNELWVDFYNVNDLREIISVVYTQKKSIFL